jgi:hypothetical protein
MERRFFEALRTVLQDYAEGSVTAEIAMEAIRKLTPIGLREAELDEVFRYGEELDDLSRREMLDVELLHRSRIRQEWSEILAFVRANGRG